MHRLVATSRARLRNGSTILSTPTRHFSRISEYLVRSKRALELWDSLKREEEMQPETRKRVYDELCAIYGSQNDSAGLQMVVEAMTAEGFTTIPLDDVLSAATHTVQDAIQYTKVPNTTLPPSVFQNLLVTCCPGEPTPQSIAKLKEVLSSAYHNVGLISSSVFSQVLQTLVKVGDYSEALKLLKLSDPSNIWREETLITAHTVYEALGDKTQNYNSFLISLYDNVTLSTTMCNKIIAFHTNRDEPMEVNKLMYHMLLNHIPLDLETLNLCLKALCEKSSESRLSAILRQFTILGLQPDLESYAYIVRWMVRIGQLSRAAKITQANPTPEVITAFIDRWIMGRDTAEAIDNFWKSIYVGEDRNFIVNTEARMKAFMGDFHTVHRLISHVDPDVSIQPKTHEDIMSACLFHNQLDFAEELFNILKFKKELTDSICNHLINLYIRHDKLDSIYTLLDDVYLCEGAILTPTPATYIDLIIYLTRQQKFDEVRFSLREIQDRAVKLNLQFYNRIFDSLLELTVEDAKPADKNGEYFRAIANRIVATQGEAHYEGGRASTQPDRDSRMTRFIFDLLNDMTNSKIMPDWITLQILLKISKNLHALELQQSLVRIAQNALLPKAFVHEMWEFVKGEEHE